MTEEQDESPTSEDQITEHPTLTSESAHESQNFASSSANGLRHDRNTAEISGETIDVVGEATGEFPPASAADAGGGENTGRSAFMVGAGILISRIIGVIRQRVFAHYLGTSDA